LLLLFAIPARASTTCPPYCSYTECTNSTCPYDSRPYAVTPYGALTLAYPWKPKDFTLIARDSASIHSYHLFYILLNDLISDSSQVILGHARSSDLMDWEVVPSVLHVRPGAWDGKYIWAPTIVAQDDSFFMFYTGVDSAYRQKIGLATSHDLYTWNRYLPGPVLSCQDVSWSQCEDTTGYGKDFRDPFVMPDPDTEGSWLMYYATRGSGAPTVMVPGLATSSDLTHWNDAGPLWSATTFWKSHPTFESPHLFEHAGTWNLVFTTDAGQPLEFVTKTGSPADTADIGEYTNNWVDWGHFADIDCINSLPLFASEYFDDTSPEGTGKEFFCNVTGGPLEIRQIQWLPDRFSLDFIPPGTIADLTVGGMGKHSAAVNWTTPPDDVDSTRGVACRYHIAYSTGMITEANFDSCDTLVVPPPFPLEPGMAECAYKGSLAPCNWYYFAVKTRDDVGNWSAMSNVVSGKTKCSGVVEAFCDEGSWAQSEGPEGWSIENSVLSLTGAGTTNGDVYRLKGKPGGRDGPARIRLSQLGEGTLSLDAARLAVVDHATGVEAYPCEGHVILGHSSAVYGVSDGTNTELSPVTDASEYARVGTAGSSWDIVLSEKDSPGQALLIEAGDGGVVSDPTKSGIEVEVPTAWGGWTTVSHLYPRRIFDALVVDSLPGSQVRLVFDQEYSIRRLARLEASETVALTPIEPDSALHSRLGHVTEAVAEAGGTTSALQSGDAVVLSYTLPAITQETERDVFLLLKGARPALAVQNSAQLEPDNESRPMAFALHQNSPNPFAGTTTIRFDLPRSEHVRLEIFDLAGRRVARIANGTFPAGPHSIDWDHRTEGVWVVQPGVYLYRIDAGEFHDQKKLILLP